MELRQLEYFMAVCAEMHFSKAAERLCTTQSNLSQQIKALELELGVPLFDRMGKRIALTEAGHLLLEQSRLIFERVDYIRGAVAELKNMPSGALKIGILPGDGDLLFDALLVDLHRTYPKLALSVVESADAYEQVVSGAVDIGVTTWPSDADARIETIPLFHEEFVLAVRFDHPLAKKGAVPFENIQRLKMILFGRDHQITKLIARLCREQKIRLDAPIEAPTLSTLLALVDKGVGASILPRLLLEYMKPERIVPVSLLQPTPSQDICIVYRKDRYQGQAARVFIEALQRFVAEVAGGDGASARLDALIPRQP